MHTETDNDVAGANRPHFVVLRGPGLGDFFEITDDELILGSDPFRADIVVRDVEVEPRHAEVYREPGGYVVRGGGAAKEGRPYSFSTGNVTLNRRPPRRTGSLSKSL